MTGTNKPRAAVYSAAARARRRIPPLTPTAAMRWDVVARLLPRDPGDLLEIGCGRGGFGARFIERAGQVVAIEPDERAFEVAVDNCGAGATVLNIGFEALPPSWTFDTLCAFEVLEHISDDRAALASWTAKLRPGGTLLLSVPAFAHRMSHCDVLVGHFRRYDPEALRDLLHQAGLVDVKLEQYGFPFGHVLEGLRNLIARRRLARADGPSTFAERTAGSGRLFQPDHGLIGSAARVISVPPILLQRLFPNRGVGLVARARRPA